MAAKHNFLLICGALTLLIFTTFGQVLHNPFINYDDDQYITKNPRVQQGLTLENVGWAFTARYASNWHPITWLSHMLDCQLFGPDPRGHHLTNLLLHIANTLLLFTVLKKMTGALWRSAFVAAAFAFHPLHVESVAWAAERKDLLCTLFWLLTMAAYLQYVRRHSAKWYLLSLLLFAVGLMAKPMLVTLPFILLLLDYWPLARITANTEPERQNPKQTIRNAIYVIREKIPFFILSAASSIITFLVQQATGAVKNTVVFPLDTRLANAAISYITYIQKMLWPSRLAIFYPYQIQELSIARVAVSTLLLLAISILVIRFSTNRRYLLVGWFWYIVTLIPVIGIVQVGIQARADRYTYIPLTGLFIIITWGLVDISARWQNRKTILAVLAFVAIWALCKCTILQLRHWQNSTAVFEHALTVAGNNNIVAHNNLGNALQTQGKLDQALAHYRQALQIDPNSADAYSNLGIVLAKQNKFDEAIEYFNQALRLRPNFVEAYNNIALALKLQGRLNEAADNYRKALQLTPAAPEIHNNFGCLLLEQKQYSEAIDHFQKATELKPGFVQAYSNLADALAAQGKFDPALEYYRKVLQLDPNNSKANQAVQAITSR